MSIGHVNSYPPVTGLSIARARLAADRERAAMYLHTGGLWDEQGPVPAEDVDRMERAWQRIAIHLPTVCAQSVEQDQQLWGRG